MTSGHGDIGTRRGWGAAGLQPFLQKMGEQGVSPCTAHGSCSSGDTGDNGICQEMW